MRLGWGEQKAADGTCVCGTRGCQGLAAGVGGDDHGPPQGPGATAKVLGSMSRGNRAPFPYCWRAWTGGAAWDSAAVIVAPHPAYTKTNKRVGWVLCSLLSR